MGMYVGSGLLALVGMAAWALTLIKLAPVLGAKREDRVLFLTMLVMAGGTVAGGVGIGLKSLVAGLFTWAMMFYLGIRKARHYPIAPVTRNT